LFPAQGKGGRCDESRQGREITEFQIAELKAVAIGEDIMVVHEG